MNALSGASIEKASKYLGIWPDAIFTFKTHIDNLVNNLRMKLVFLYWNKSCFPMAYRQRIVKGIFFHLGPWGSI